MAQTIGTDVVIEALWLLRSKYALTLQLTTLTDEERNIARIKIGLIDRELAIRP